MVGFADPEGEFDFGGGAGEIGHGVLVVFDALALAIFHGKAPKPDEVVSYSGLPDETVSRWDYDGFKTSAHFRNAKRTGVDTSHNIHKLK